MRDHDLADAPLPIEAGEQVELVDHEGGGAGPKRPMHLVEDDQVVAPQFQPGVGQHVGGLLRGERARPGHCEHGRDDVVSGLRQGADVEVNGARQVDRLGGLLAEQSSEPSHRVRQAVQAGQQVAHRGVIGVSHIVNMIHPCWW